MNFVADVRVLNFLFRDLSSGSDEEPEELQQQPQLAEELRPRRPAQASRRRSLLNRLQESSPCRACQVGRKWSRRLNNSKFETFHATLVNLESHTELLLS